MRAYVTQGQTGLVGQLFLDADVPFVSLLALDIVGGSHRPRSDKETGIVWKDCLPGLWSTWGEAYVFPRPVRGTDNGGCGSISFKAACENS